ncbi:MAG: aspartate aminotransferase family protein [Holophaga sp.]|nr:aspartate aminotransferase family protein [Holophaga sp.]
MLTGNELADVTHGKSGTTKEWLAKAADCIPRGVAIVNEVFAAEAKGAVIQDLDGNIYLDCFAGVGVLNGGHRPQPVVDAIKAQADKYLHTFFHQMPHQPYVALAEKVVKLAPGDFKKKAAFFNSGSECVENAVKIARIATKRDAVICFGCAYHGRTMLTASLTYKLKPYKVGFGPSAPGIHRAATAYCYRCPWNSTYPGCGMHCLEQFKPFFKGEVDPAEVAAMVIEPVHGEGGIVVPPKEFLPGLKAICAEHGILFVADEVQTGFYRSGKPFAVSQSGVVPDLLACAKSIAAGMPLSGVVGRAEIMDAPAPGQLGGTFSGNPVSCAAGVAALDYYETQDLGGRAEKINQYVMGRLRAMQAKLPALGDIRALGAMIGVEFVKDPRTKEPYPEAVKRITRECFDRGLIVLGAGVFDNVIRMLMPLVITDDQMAQAMDIFEASCTRVLS